MFTKEEFITAYLDDYVRMAYRRLINRVNTKDEMKLVNNLYSLMDEYAEGELLDYVHYNKII